MSDNVCQDILGVLRSTVQILYLQQPGQFKVRLDPLGPQAKLLSQRGNLQLQRSP